MATKKKKPLKADVAIMVRVSAEQKTSWELAAGRDGRSLSSWIRRALDEASGSD